MTKKCKISVVIPVLNEAESLRPLVSRLMPVLSPLGSHEVIFVDDGSDDDTSAVLEALHNEYPDIIKAIHLRVKRGKSIALQCGFDVAVGQLVVMMDGDLQDHPEEIPKLVEYLEENNLDTVTGWKVNRQDSIIKTLPSRYFNFMLRWLSGLDIHDFNCGLKVFRAECVKRLKIYGQLHRFMLVLIKQHGFKVGEVKVKHSSRKYGYSKYGKRRLYEALMDFMTVIFISRYLQSPLYFFGFYGLVCFFFSVLIGSFFIALHILSWLTDFPHGSLNEHPLWLGSPFLFLAGLIFVSFGLVCDMVYYQSNTRLYQCDIQKKVGFEKNNKEQGYKS